MAVSESSQGFRNLGIRAQSWGCGSSSGVGETVGRTKEVEQKQTAPQNLLIPLTGVSEGLRETHPNLRKGGVKGRESPTALKNGVREKVLEGRTRVLCCV